MAGWFYAYKDLIGKNRINHMLKFELKFICFDKKICFEILCKLVEF